MQKIIGREAVLAALHDPALVVPPVPVAPPGSRGISWLRATVGRFSTGREHQRRRALSVAVLDAIPPQSLRAAAAAHPVAILARAMNVEPPGAYPVRVVGPVHVVDLVRDVAQAYQPGTGDAALADAAVDRLVQILGDVPDEPTAARIGVLVQACEATAVLIERARHRPIDDVLRDDPPVPATRRLVLAATTVCPFHLQPGELVQLCLAGDLAFGAGARRCPGQAHALALVEAALACTTSPPCVAPASP